MYCPRRPCLHCDNTIRVMILEEGMSVMRLPARHGVRPRTLLVLAVLVLTSCQTAYYAAMEKLGYPKRDLLVSRVQQARDSQQAAKEQFQSALEHFRAVAHFRGGELEAKYNALSAELERSEARAQTVHQRIAAVENVAEALFKEWEAELAQYGPPGAKSGKFTVREWPKSLLYGHSHYRTFSVRCSWEAWLHIPICLHGDPMLGRPHINPRSIEVQLL